MKIKDIQDIFHKELDVIYGKEEVDSFFFMILDDYFNIFRIELALNPGLSITKEEQVPIFKALDELKNEKPIQYILGKTEFFGLHFKVNNHVLIPRPETEELVDWILQNANIESELRILDIGTGSGCIAISLAKHLVNSEIFALDVSPEAIELAIENAVLNNVKVNFIQANILDDGLEGKRFNKYDIIVSNPPYVMKRNKDQLKPNVLNYEPHAALFVEDNDPLKFIRAISNFALANLKNEGLLYFEINEFMGAKIRELLEDHDFTNIELKRDMFNKYRMIKATRLI